MEPDILPDQPLQHRLHVADDRVEVQDRGFQDLLAAEGQELARERAGSFAGFGDLLDASVQGVAVSLAGEDEAAVPQNDREEIVEVVGDAPGQTADRFHLL